MTTVVITRPQGDEAYMSEQMLSRGWHVIHEPLTEIVLMHTQRHEVARALADDPDAIILTSRRGAQALAMLTEIRDLFLICVGDATAQVAESLGFSRISTAGGNVRALTNYLTDSYDEDARLLYISGAQISTDLPALLAENNMRVERIPVYEAIAAQHLSDTLAEQLKRGQIDALTFMSPRAAQIFIHLAKQADVLGALIRTDAFCLSGAIAEPLSAGPWKSIQVSEEATLASLLECMDNAL